MPQPSINKMSVKCTYQKCHLNFPGVNELTDEDPINGCIHVLPALKVLITVKVYHWLNAKDT